MNKDFPLKLKTLEDDGTFEGYASTFGNVDLDGDRVDPTAFNRTLRSFRGEVPILFDHDPGRPVGVTTEMAPDAHGLRIKGRLVLETVAGREAYELLKARAIRGLSIGVQVIRDAWEDGIRVLKELRLHEVSLVAIPADPFAEVLAVKRRDGSSTSESAEALPPVAAPAEQSGDPVCDHSLSDALRALTKSINAIKEIAQ